MDPVENAWLSQTSCFPLPTPPPPPHTFGTCTFSVMEERALGLLASFGQYQPLLYSRDSREHRYRCHLPAFWLLIGPETHLNLLSPPSLFPELQDISLPYLE